MLTTPKLLLVALANLALISASPVVNDGVKCYKALELPEPHNWVLRSPSDIPELHIISGYGEEFDQYTPEQWSTYILEEAKRWDCDWSISHAAWTRGAYNAVPPHQMWFGTVGKGRPLTIEDFRRDVSLNSNTSYATVHVTTQGAYTSPWPEPLGHSKVVKFAEWFLFSACIVTFLYVVSQLMRKESPIPRDTTQEPQWNLKI